MKLTLNREEAKKGLLKKSTVYYLHVSLDVTPEEMKLIKKHNWQKQQVYVDDAGSKRLGDELSFDFGYFLGKPRKQYFESIEDLVDAEKQLIESAKVLNSNLDAAEEGFASDGPREIEL